jgi:hypothetical protein
MTITLTSEQMAALPEFREQWLRIGLSTEPANKPLAEESIGALYEFCGFKRPKKFIWMGSPFGCQIYLNMLKIYGGQLQDPIWCQIEDLIENQLWRQIKEHLWDQLDSKLRNQIGSQLRFQIWDQLESQLRNQIGSQLQEQIWNQIGRQLRDQIWNQLGAHLNQLEIQLQNQKIWGQLDRQLWDQVKSQLHQLQSQILDKIGDQIENQLLDQLRNQIKGHFSYFYTTLYSYGSIEAYWIARYRFAQSIGVEFGDKQLEGLDHMENVARSCFWWYPFKDFCIISDRPSEIHIENGLLHNETGPAIMFRDGYAHWAIDGVTVPQKVVMNPEELTVAEIDEERNAEVRRVMIQRFGPKRYMEESGAKCIDMSAGLGLIGSGPRALYETKDGSKWLVGSDGSSKRIYWMPVPREAKTCTEAHCLIAGIDNEARCIAEA